MNTIPPLVGVVRGAAVDRLERMLETRFLTPRRANFPAQREKEKRPGWGGCQWGVANPSETGRRAAVGTAQQPVAEGGAWGQPSAG